LAELSVVASSPLLLLAKMERRVQMAPMESLVKTVCLAQMVLLEKMAQTELTALTVVTAQRVLPEQMDVMEQRVQPGSTVQLGLQALMVRTDSTERQARLVRPGKTAQWVPPDRWAARPVHVVTPVHQEPRV
jgi:hypothetical protein